jgi:hypothetical protein
MGHLLLRQNFVKRISPFGTFYNDPFFLSFHTIIVLGTVS